MKAKPSTNDTSQFLGFQAPLRDRQRVRELATQCEVSEAVILRHALRHGLDRLTQEGGIFARTDADER
jgi:hypothetical protein